jgi:hypothetical protein
MSKGGGGSQSTNTIQKVDPWTGAQPYLKGGLSDLAKWYQSDFGRSPFPGSTVVPFSPFTEQALGASAQRAQMGSPVTQAAQGNAAATLRGDFLDPESNPWLSRTFDLAAGKMRAGLDSQFNQSGGYGGSLHEGARAEQLGDLATNLYGGNYDAERQRQMQANVFAPQLANQDYFDFGQLANVGQAYEQQAGNYLGDAMGRYDFSQQQPLNRLRDFFGIASPVAGQGQTSSSTTTGPNNSNSLTNILGGVSSLAGIGNSLGLFGGAAGAAGAAALIPQMMLGAAGSASAGELALLAMAASDPAMKRDIEPVDDDEILERSERVPAYSYRYRRELGPKFGGLKMGPMADDFAREFGGDGHVIPMPKLLGVLWAKQNALANKLKKLEAA